MVDAGRALSSIVLLDDRAPPYPLHQAVLVDELAAEPNQNLKNARLQCICGRTTARVPFPWNERRSLRVIKGAGCHAKQQHDSSTSSRA